jgi:3-oxoacyl-[acyl-carrier-protein] synthase III
MSQDRRTIIESIGVYLPPCEISTKEIVEGCVHGLDIPLEKLTGIRTRRRAGREEFAIDLAEKAARECLVRSRFGSHDIDVIVCCNISRWDAPNQVFFEPATSVRLKQRLGLRADAVAIDLSNACAGMWTGVLLVNSLLRTGEVRCGLVVSGEYITHLIDTAQKEVRDFMDAQLASLTLGDAGAAVTLTRGGSEHHGLVDLELYTLSKFSRFCIAKPTTQPHGGAAMHTDAIMVSEAVIPHAAKHAHEVLRRNSWDDARVDHVIPHQTSELTMKAGLREMRRLFQHDFSDRLVNNLAERGNTSSNAHFVALYDAIRNKVIHTNDSVVFCISGSGQSTGTALYVMDDLPRRMLSEQPNVSPLEEEIVAVLPVQLEVEAWAVALHSEASEPDTVKLVADAAEACLGRSAFQRQEIDFLLAASTYRSEFLMEPAVAALVAGTLRMNDDREPADQHKTLAFDVTNGDVGFLKAVYLAAELVRAGQGRNAMVVASELENNVTRRPDHLLGIRAAASAIVLRESQGESGFLSFGFRDYPELAKVREVHGGWHDGGRTVCLTRCEQGDVGAMFLECLLESVRRFLESAQTSLADIHWFVPTQHSEAFLRGFAAGLDIDPRRVVNLKPAVHGDPQTSTFTLAMDEGIRTGRFKKGDLFLVASVCGGVQVGCSLYRV